MDLHSESLIGQPLFPRKAVYNETKKKIFRFLNEVQQFNSHNSPYSRSFLMQCRCYRNLNKSFISKSMMIKHEISFIDI